MTRDSASALQLLQRDTHLVIVRRFELVLGANRQLPEARVHPERQNQEAAEVAQWNYSSHVTRRFWVRVKLPSILLSFEFVQ